MMGHAKLVGSARGQRMRLEQISLESPTHRLSGFAGYLFFVMPGLVPGIHVFSCHSKEDVDGRVKPGHDEL